MSREQIVRKEETVCAGYLYQHTIHLNMSKLRQCFFPKGGLPKDCPTQFDGCGNTEEEAHWDAERNAPAYLRLSVKDPHNQFFGLWGLCWQKSERGGKYTFDIPKMKG